MPDLDKIEARFRENLRRAEAVAMAVGADNLERIVNGHGLREATYAGASWDRADPEGYRFRSLSEAPFISQPDDYINGRCRPLYETEDDLKLARGIGRHVVSFQDLGVAVLNNLRNYTVGEGNAVAVTAKAREGKEWVERLQQFVDEFLEENELTDDGESDMLAGSVTDGDILLQLRQHGSGVPRVRFIGGEQIVEPDKKDEVEAYLGARYADLDWTFGVASHRMDPGDVRGYFVNWFGQVDNGWEFVPESQSVFIKRNVPKQCKRGVSDFYLPYSRIDRAAKLLDRTALGATIQASIAYIKEAETGGTTAEVENALGARLGGPSRLVTDLNGHLNSVKSEDYLGGRVPVLRGMKYHAGPMGSPNGPAYLDVYQGIVRAVGNRWCMPEYMISGDASNANYSSTLVAKSPFVQQVRQEQSNLARQERKLIWKAIAMVADEMFGVPVSYLKRMVSIEVTPPAPESQDPLKDEQVYGLQRDRGILSAKTHAAKVGLDYDEERTNGAKESEDCNCGAAEPAGLATSAVSRVAESLRGITFSGLSENCGTGDGGFKSGNKCGKEKGGGDATATAVRPKKSGKPSSAERLAVEDYSSDKFKDINAGLRSGNLSSSDSRIVNDLDGFLEKSPKRPGATVRSFDIEPGGDIDRMLQPGAIFKDDAFVSTRAVPTTTDRAAFTMKNAPSGRVVMRIDGKSGVDISNISMNPGESEVLYPRGTRFRVSKVERTPQGGILAMLSEVDGDVQESYETYIAVDAAGSLVVRW